MKRLILLIFLACAAGASAQTVRLPDHWHIIDKDAPAFSEPQTDDSKWPIIWVPSQLQQEGFELADGVIWFRVHFDVDAKYVGQPMWLVIGKIDAADETFINGVKVGQMGAFPPQVKTAWSETRSYRIPAGTLQKTNVLAIRVYHNGTLGGVTSGPIGLYTDADYDAEFKPPQTTARQTFHQIVTANGRIAAVYDTEHDVIWFVLPHIFQAYESKRQVKAVMRHLATKQRHIPKSVAYERDTHVIRIDYGDVTVRWFAAFTGPDGPQSILYAVVRGPAQKLQAWDYTYDRGSGTSATATATFDQGHEKWFIFAVADPDHPDPKNAVRALSRLKPGLLADELQFMQAVHGRCHIPPHLQDAERHALLQSVTVLKMAQVAPNEVFPQARGQIVAGLPPGAYNVTWVRDGFYATMALLRLGLYPEARRMLTFELQAPVGDYVHYKAPNGRDVGVGRPYRISVCRYFGNGHEESFEYGDGPNIELDGFGLFLTAYTKYVEGSGDRTFDTRWRAVVTREVADVTVACIDDKGLIRAESGPWERYLDFKQFTYTSVACARGLSDFARLEPDHGYELAAARLKAAITFLLVMPGQGWLKGNYEAKKPDEYDSHDGGTFEAFSMGVLDNRDLFRTQLAEYTKVLRVPGQGRGFARINDGDAYETAEWVLLDLRVASALAMMGDHAAARPLVAWITAQAARNFNLIPEVYRRDNAAYDGSIPMVGFGAGAYITALLDLYAPKKE